MTHKAKKPTPVTNEVRELVRKYAEAGTPCPTNAQMAEALGRAVSAIENHLHLLAEMGVLYAENANASRRIVFSDGIATGWSIRKAKSKSAPRPIKPREEPIIHHWQPDTRDLTGRLLGDPPPHRSALAQMQRDEAA